MFHVRFILTVDHGRVIMMTSIGQRIEDSLMILRSITGTIMRTVIPIDMVKMPRLMNVILKIVLIVIGMCILQNLRVCAWNMHGFVGGKEYLEVLSKSFDIVALSEHWLFPQENYRIVE